ncbi:MAG: hypothetical protein JXR70_06720 [Spirochaetales bacterium]|nr:hypothetical protein [Spirochaetales bacterium]
MKSKYFLIISIITIMLFSFSCVSQDTSEKGTTPKETGSQVKTIEQEKPETTITDSVVEQPVDSAKTEPTAEPKKEVKVPSAGTAFFSPNKLTTKLGDVVTANIHLHSGDQKVAAYGFSVIYDSQILELQKDKGKEGFEAGPDGFIAVTNTQKPGEAIAAGFDVNGKGPGSNLDFLRVYFKSKAKGTTACEVVVNNLNDEKAGEIGSFAGGTLEIVIQ